MESGSITDDQITASSSLEGISPSQARVISVSFNPDNNKPWSPAQGDADAYLQVDFSEPTEVTGIATQGRVVRYTVDYQAVGGEDWTTVAITKVDTSTGERTETPVEFEGW